MSRRIFHIVSSLGLSIFILFMLASTPVLAKSNNTTMPLTVNTHVICSPATFFTSSGWQDMRDGPASFGCGGHAWETTTPTKNFVQYNLGVVSVSATYGLRAFITGNATAPMNYDIYAANTGSLIKPCFFPQSTAIAWADICTFTVDATKYYGQQLTIVEWSGSVSSHIMSASAIQI